MKRIICFVACIVALAVPVAAQAYYVPGRDARAIDAALPTLRPVLGPCSTSRSLDVCWGYADLTSNSFVQFYAAVSWPSGAVTFFDVQFYNFIPRPQRASR